jgi:hypothetical protein
MPKRERREEEIGKEDTYCNAKTDTRLILLSRVEEVLEDTAILLSLVCGRQVYPLVAQY